MRGGAGRTPDRLSALLAEHGFATLRDEDLLEISVASRLPRAVSDLGQSLPDGHVLVAERS